MPLSLSFLSCLLHTGAYAKFQAHAGFKPKEAFSDRQASLLPLNCLFFFPSIFSILSSCESCCRQLIYMGVSQKASGLKSTSFCRGRCFPVE